MIVRQWIWLLPASLLLTQACAQAPQTVPPPALPEPVAASVPEARATLAAGFGRADITPPPGVGLFGYGPEAKRARGYRNRLYARALLLQDADGERIAFVVADLGVVSVLLHRLVAARVVERTGIGPDRLILSATHTHAGPSHYMDTDLLNENGSSVPGFDAAMVEFLVQRISSSVTRAERDLRPARVAWAMVPVWGYTRNRSIEAFRQNQPPPDLPVPPEELALDARHRAIDPMWTMLRVDQLDEESGDYRPAGALSIFAIHGTAIPSVNELFDADIHAPVQRGLERHIDARNGAGDGFTPQAVHLFANGSQGDVSPSWPEGSRCPPPTLGRGRRPDGPRRPPAPEEWLPPSPDTIASCLTTANRFIDSVGDSLAARAIAIFDSLGARLTDDLRIARRFRSIPLRGESKPAGLCEPRIGTSTLVGGPDGYTRFTGWRLLGLFPVGFEEGGSAIDSDTDDCHREKRVFLGFMNIVGLIVGAHGFPEVAQLTLARVGDLLVAAAPAELTVGTGSQVRKAIREAARSEGLDANHIAIIGLANGDLRYITTAQEYTVQSYEGGSTLYGPNSAQFLADEFARLARELGGPGPDGDIPLDTFISYPGRSREIFPDSTSGPPVERIERVITESLCAADTAVARWVDAYPGRLIPADGALLRIERRTANGWVTGSWDDDRQLEVRAIRQRGSRGYEWEARWTGGRSGETYRWVLVAGHGFPALVGDSFASCSP